MKHIVDKNNTGHQIKKDAAILTGEYGLDPDGIFDILSACSIVTFDCPSEHNPDTQGIHILKYCPDIETALKIHGPSILEVLTKTDIYAMRQDIQFIERCMQPVGATFPFYSTEQHVCILTEFRNFLFSHKQSILTTGQPDNAFMQSPCIDKQFSKTLYLDQEHISMIDPETVKRIEAFRPLLFDAKLAILNVIISSLQKSFGPKQMFSRATDILTQVLSAGQIKYLIELEELLSLDTSNHCEKCDPLWGDVIGNIPDIIRMIGVYCMEMRTGIYNKMANLLSPLLKRLDIDGNTFYSLSWDEVTADEAYFNKLIPGKANCNVQILHTAIKEWEILNKAENEFWFEYETWVDEYLASKLEQDDKTAEKDNRQMQMLVPIKEILTMAEAADYMDVSKHRLQNIISIYKRENGRLPDWVGDGKGSTRRVVKRVEFEDWLGSRKVKRGRPSNRID